MQRFQKSIRRPVQRVRWRLLLPGVLALATGCQVAQETVRLPAQMVTAVVPGKKKLEVDLAALQVELQRFADEYTSRTTAALEDYERSLGTAAARSEALQWKLASGTAAVSIASGPNPSANLLDFLALTSITRTALEEVWTKTTNGPAFQSWLRASIALETNAWQLVNGVLTSEQQSELRTAIRDWWIANPDARTGFFVRPQEFSALIRKTKPADSRSGTLFGLVGLDPTAGLDPAVREVTRTRLFAERALFMAQRMPFLLRWQVQLMSNELLQQAEVREMVRSTERLSRAAESASQTAAALPERISAERKIILEALAAQEGGLRELSVELARTLAAGQQMSASLNTTLVTFDGLMKRFGVGEPAASPPDTNSRPFNILEYAETAEKVALMAQQLDGLLKDAGGTLDSPALDDRIARLEEVSKRAKADARSVLNHAFLLAAGLVVLAFLGAIAYRRLGARIAP